MKQLRLFILAAAAACIAASAQASVVLNFDNPDLITFSPDFSTQTLVESGYALSGPAFSFFPIDNAGDGVIVGDGTSFSLQQVGGGIFSLLGLDYAFDPIFGPTAGDLSVVGLIDGIQVAMRTLNLGTLSSALFDDSWQTLTSVTFSASSGFSIDNVAVVPEPSSLALVALSLGVLVARERRAGAVRAS